MFGWHVLYLRLGVSGVLYNVCGIFDLEIMDGWMLVRGFGLLLSMVDRHQQALFRFPSSMEEFCGIVRLFSGTAIYDSMYIFLCLRFSLCESNMVVIKKHPKINGFRVP